MLPWPAPTAARLNAMPSAEDDPGRSSSLDIMSYDVAVDLTYGTEIFRSHTDVRFRCRSAGIATLADVDAASIQRATLNGADLDVAAGRRGSRLALPRLADDNILTVEAEFAYTAAPAGLHYVSDPEDGSACVYSRCYPHGAPRIYCCFDEPDLRAAFTLSVRAPAGWSCLANAPVLSRPRQGDPGLWRFAPTAPIPPWLSSLCAGPYSGSALRCERDGGDPLPVTVQAVPSAAAFLEPGRMAELLAQPLRYYEHHLGVPYPYRKCDLVFVPGLQALAYSVPGLIVIQDEVLTNAEARTARYTETVIAHELAHAWLGGLVTMRSHEQMWLDEALTTYVSRTALAEIYPGTAPWDTATSASLPDHAYASNAAAIRELEGLIGRRAVLGGLGILLRRHAHSSVTKEDLVRCWSQVSGRDLGKMGGRNAHPGRR